MEEHEAWILVPQTVVRFVLKSQVTNKFKTYNYSVVFDWECLQNFMLAWSSRFRFPVGDGNSYLHYHVQNGCIATQPPIQWVSEALSLRLKRPGREADHSPPCCTEVKNEWSYTSTPPVRPHGVVLS
jgi:hypothetical protein